MDREFALYLIEQLDQALPLEGVYARLDFAARPRIDSYQIDEELRLVIPLRLEARDGSAPRVIEAPIVPLEDEDAAIDGVMRWCVSWHDALAMASHGELAALSEEEFALGGTGEDHPLRAAIARKSALLDACDAAIPREEIGQEEGALLRFAFMPHQAESEARVRWRPFALRWGRALLPHLELCLRTIVWDRVDGALIIRDIKEQTLRLDTLKLAPHLHKLPAYLEGWGMALEEVSARGAVSSARAAELMPCDLFFPETLKLKRCVDAESFARAHMVRSRLGKLV